MDKNKIRNIVILGSTGSIGTQALDIIADFPERFRAVVLTANKNWRQLAEQALRFNPKSVVIADDSYYANLKEALKGTDIEVKAGPESIVEAVEIPEADMVLTAMVGYSGLIPTIHAIKARKTIALANKETLVVAGEIITRLADQHGVKILPVDSEHSAIFQCLAGEDKKAMKSILLTASGGPFRNLSIEQLGKVTVTDALNHPNWDMGAKVTIDSASMMNKGFEMIEAKWLFDCDPDRIKILVHPQSIVHSMVEFHDGSVKAQLGIPDMHIPIQYALSYPQRLSSDKYLLDWNKITQLTFQQPDFEKFPLLQYAFDAIKKGGNLPCILNAANEVAVKAFLGEKIKFTQLPEVTRYTMDHTPFIPHPSLDQLVETNKEAVKIAQDWLEIHCMA